MPGAVFFRAELARQFGGTDPPYNLMGEKCGMNCVKRKYEVVRVGDQDRLRGVNSSVLMIPLASLM